jgi:hypothetical protein
LSDDGDPDVPLDELLMTVAQLRDVPAAERSAVVAKENQGERPVRPQARKVNLRSVEGEDLGVGRALTDFRMHAAERTGTKIAERIGVRADTL